MLFVDSSDPAEVRDLFAWGAFSGVTTNPLLLARDAPQAEAGRDLRARLLAVVEASTGPVSIELLAEEEGEMLAEAERWRELDPARVCVKVPFSEAGLRVVRGLAARGATTNATCIMSFPQGYLAALAGATYVSLFAGRVRDMGYDPAPVIRALRAQLDREGLPARIIVGSIRQPSDVVEALEAGAHVVTVPPPLLRRMLHNPKTDETIREFAEAFRARFGG